MTLRKKILGGFALVFLIGLILGICGLFSTNTLTTLSDEQYALQTANSEVANVLNAHYIWRHGLTEAVLADAEFKVSVDPSTCALGQWRNSEAAKNITDDQILSLLKQVDEPHAYIHNQADVIKAMLAAGDTEGAKRDLLDNVLPRTADVITILTKMQTRYGEILDAKSAEVTSIGRQMTILIIILIAAAIAVCLLLAWLITGSIMKPVRMMADAAENIAVGDLDVHIDYAVKDEIGSLADSFKKLIVETQKQVSAAEALAGGDLTVAIKQRSGKDVMNGSLQKMIDNFNTMFEELKASSSQVSSGSGQVSQSAQVLASASAEQAASVQELTAAITDVRGQVDESARSSAKALENCDTAGKLMDESMESMGAMLKAMSAIDESSQSITRVIKVIDDIAFQTNILALNAAVEAARAGQHGKGFAVVADEVRSLAAKSAEAAKETAGLIEGSSQRVSEGSRIVERTNESLQAVNATITENAELIREMAGSLERQTSSVVEINQGMDQISSVVQSNSATAEQSAAAAEEMSAQSVLMNEIVARFRIKESGYGGFEPSHSAQSTGFSIGE